MPDPLSALIDERAALLHQVAERGDFQPGSISSPAVRCGKPSCHCAKPEDPGHGPYCQLTQKIEGKTVTQSLPSPAAIHKAEREIAEYRKFQRLTDDLLGVNRKICRSRPFEQTAPSAPKTTTEAIQKEVAREVAQLLRIIFRDRKATGRLDLESIETAIRAARSPWQKWRGPAHRRSLMYGLVLDKQSAGLRWWPCERRGAKCEA